MTDFDYVSPSGVKAALAHDPQPLSMSMFLNKKDLMAARAARSAGPSPLSSQEQKTP